MPKRGRPSQRIKINSEAKDQLEKLTLLSGPSRIAKRAQVVLLSSAGYPNEAITKQLDLEPCVRK